MNVFLSTVDTYDSCDTYSPLIVVSVPRAY